MKITLSGQSPGEKPRVLELSSQGSGQLSDIRLWVHSPDSPDSGWEIRVKADELRRAVLALCPRMGE